MKNNGGVIQKWIETVNDGTSKPLTDWEENFMVDITDQFDRCGYITDRQEETLERIYANKTN